MRRQGGATSEPACGSAASRRNSNSHVQTLTRYILFEIIKVFAITLTAMTLFMILVSVSTEAYSQGLGLKQIVLLLPYVLPEALRFSVPGTILFATCSVYGRMASSNEIVAIKALGISPWTIIWPTFALAFALSLAAVVLNDLACSWGRDGTRRVVIESVEEIAYSRLAQQRSYSNPQFSINVQRVDGKKLVRPIFTFAGGGSSPPTTITCEEAELQSDLKAGMLKIICRNSTFDIGGVRGTNPGVFEEVDLAERSEPRRGQERLRSADVPGRRRSCALAGPHREAAAKVGVLGGGANGHGRFRGLERSGLGRRRRADRRRAGADVSPANRAGPAVGEWL